MTYAIVTFGCRVNTADSLAIEAALRRNGATPASAEVANLVIVNTCSVTATADQGARQLLRRIARDNPSARIVATGCYASRQPDDLAPLPGVAAVIGNDAKDPERLLPCSRDLPAVRSSGLARSETEREPSFADRRPCGTDPQPGFAGRTAWTLAVQTGCEERCSYCIIPNPRCGPQRCPSGGPRARGTRGHARLPRRSCITGVHLGVLRPRPRATATLAGLVRRLASRGSVRRAAPAQLHRADGLHGRIDRPRRRRLPSHRTFTSPSNTRAIACWRRCVGPYDLAHYQRVANRIRECLPDAAIGADVMVGFPGEEDDDVDVLCGYFERSPLTTLHVFPYSERPGTDAAAYPRKIHGRDARDRARRVREIGARLHERFVHAQVGRRYRALTLDDGTLALTGNYCKVRIPPGNTRNAWVTVRIDSAGPEMTGVVTE